MEWYELGTEMLFLLQHPLKSIRAQERDTPQNSGRMYSWSCQHPTRQRSHPCTLQGAPTGCLSAQPVCAGGVSKNNSMLSPKLLPCSVCPFVHVTSHFRENICSVMPGHPDEATKTELRGMESFPVCPMSRPPTSFQLSRLCSGILQPVRALGEPPLRASPRG